VHRDVFRKCRVAILDLEAREIEDVTRPAGFDQIGGGVEVDWARTSERIAFVGRMVGEKSALWVGELTDGPDGPSLQHPQKVVDEYHAWGLPPSWSPDDAQLVFVKSMPPPARLQLWTVDVLNGEQTFLAVGEKKNSVRCPDWRRF